jgi:hypothetical protein
LAIEAAFVNEVPIDDPAEKLAFARRRIRVNATVPGT